MPEPKTDEIEITPEMIEAGANELCSFNRNFESEEQGVRRIFLAMVAQSAYKEFVGLR